MRNIFKPAIILMNRLKFLKKFGLIFIISLLPMLLILFNLVMQINQKIEINNNQMIGLNYNSALMSLIQHTQQHRGLSSTYLAGNTSVKNQINQKQEELQKDIENIDYINSKYDKLLKTNEKWNEVREKLIDIEKNVFNMSLWDAVSKQTTLIEEILNLNSDMADSSSLILQQEAYKYYLVDNIIYKLPRTTEYMGQSRALGSAVAAKGNETKDEKFKLLYLSRTMSIALGDSERGINIVYNTYPESKKAIEETYSQALNSSKKLVDIINDKFINTDDIKIKSEEYYTSATNSINDVYVLLNSISSTYSDINQQEKHDLIIKRDVLASVSTVAMILIVYLYIGFYLAVKGTITTIEKSSSVIAEGDLSQYVDHDVKDETKVIIDSLNKIVKSFSNIITSTQKVSYDVVLASNSLNQITEQTTEATNQIAESIQEIASGAESQLHDTNAATKIIRTMDYKIREIAQSSFNVSKSSNEMESEAGNGNKMINGAIFKMNNINLLVEESNIIINSLGERSKNIGQIISAITEISTQTDLLALNAAIEASKAGEQGKGFAVVADEVRKLSEKSSISANEISGLIKSMQKDTFESVEQMKKVMIEVKDGVSVVSKAGTAFERILENIKGVVSQIKEISVISEEMSENSEEATASLLKISEIANKASISTQNVAAASQQQLASMEEVVSSTEDLNNKAIELQKMIDKFNV